MSDALHKLFVTCPAGLESLLLEELKGLGIEDVKETITGVICHGHIEDAYRACLWSRFANRVLLVLAEGHAGNREALYRLSDSVDWLEHLKEAATIRVDFAGSNGGIRHTQFGAQVVKDAIVDQFQQRGLKRPEVALVEPNHRLNVRLTSKSCYVSLDLSGESLHKRGYRVGTGSAPIKENLAAGLLTRAKWPRGFDVASGFVDPMCGSGTFMIEAIMMAANIAPGLMRDANGFEYWLKHDASAWQRLKKDAAKEKEDGLAEMTKRFVGFELDASVARQARKNIDAAGLSEYCEIFENPLADTDLADKATKRFDGLAPGLIVVNPPYGMRMGEEDELTAEYRDLADLCKRYFPSWTMGILSSNPSLLAETRLRTEKKYKIFNGKIPCEFRIYQLMSVEQQSKQHEREETRSEHTRKPVKLSPAVEMVANRLRKNIKKLKNWKNKNNVSCYRVYDADMPEYSAAIDNYNGKLHIQEYQAPKSIDENKAKVRFDDLVTASRHVFEVDHADVFIKTRRRNKGLTQYEKQAELGTDDFYEVSEGVAKFQVNLKSYLDTGLFLDHRPLRLKIGDISGGKSFLNLFSYTSTATVHAVLGGATESTSVDMSNTYVAWSKNNFQLNSIRSDKHEVIRADVTKWLDQCRRGYDIIMLDPPSFSNSKKMGERFDVQDDHVSLVHRCMELLTPGGVLFFSNNLRSFKLDNGLSERYEVKNISAETIDMDFSRNKKIHVCFEIRHR